MSTDAAASGDSCRSTPGLDSKPPNARALRIGPRLKNELIGQAEIADFNGSGYSHPPWKEFRRGKHRKRSPEGGFVMRKALFIAVILAGSAILCASAQAQVRIGIGIGAPAYRPYPYYHGYPYYYPYPYRVYVAPPPPVYVAPAPVYVTRPPAYQQPAAVYASRPKPMRPRRLRPNRPIRRRQHRSAPRPRHCRRSVKCRPAHAGGLLEFSCPVRGGAIINRRTFLTTACHCVAQAVLGRLHSALLLRSSGTQCRIRTTGGVRSNCLQLRELRCGGASGKQR